MPASCRVRGRGRGNRPAILVSRRRVPQTGRTRCAVVGDGATLVELRTVRAALVSSARRQHVRVRGVRHHPTPQALTAARATPGDRLLEQPVFVMSSIRSGSTLLRVMLNSHPRIHAPHELHLASIRVDLRGKYAGRAMEEIDLDTARLQYLLW